MNRKHTKYDKIVTSLQCQNCGKEFINAGEFKEHICYDVYTMNVILGVLKTNNRN